MNPNDIPKIEDWWITDPALRAYVLRLQNFAVWAYNTRDDEGIPATYEDIANKAEEALTGKEKKYF